MPEEKGKDLPDDKAKEVLRTMLLSERDYNARYHDHKETMGWAATTLYLAALIGLAKVGVDECKIGLVLLVFFTFIALLFFIYALFSDRAKSANIVAACTTMLTRLNDPGFTLNECMLSPKDPCGGGYEYPKILCDEIDVEFNRQRHEKCENLKRLSKLKFCKISSRNWYIWSPYFVLFLWTIAFLLSILF